MRQGIRATVLTVAILAAAGTAVPAYARDYERGYRDRGYNNGSYRGNAPGYGTKQYNRQDSRGGRKQQRQLPDWAYDAREEGAGYDDAYDDPRDSHEDRHYSSRGRYDDEDADDEDAYYDAPRRGQGKDYVSPFAPDKRYSSQRGRVEGKRRQDSRDEGPRQQSVSSEEARFRAGIYERETRALRDFSDGMVQR